MNEKETDPIDAISRIGIKRGPNIQIMKKVLIGIILSGVLVYLSLRGIHFRGVAASIHHIHLPYVLLSLSMMFLMQLLRSIRWGGS